MCNDRFRPLESSSVASHHDGELPVFGTRLTSGDRRIEEIETALFRLGGELPRHFRRSGGMVDENRAFGHLLKRAVRPQRDFAQVRIVADAGEHDGCPFCRFGRSVRESSIVLAYPRLGLGSAAVVDVKLVAALVHELSCHRKAHHAETDKREFAHCSPPLRFFSPSERDSPIIIRSPPTLLNFPSK